MTRAWSIMMTRVQEHCDDKVWSIVITGDQEHCDYMGSEYCDYRD